MSDFLEELKYKLQPLTEKLGGGDKAIGKLALYAVIVVVGFGVLIWQLWPSSRPISSNPRIPQAAATTDDTGDVDRPPPPPSGSSRMAPGADG
ncbi:hypothetical protein AY599_27590 [Leptolyngbya valderiana BDU 20041]|nr:hypothetical protein AY599_27590 [Leptolyngbya valderiana BDU 20041]